jgi:hypothetical protein
MAGEGSVAVEVGGVVAGVTAASVTAVPCLLGLVAAQGWAVALVVAVKHS